MDEELSSEIAKLEPELSDLPSRVELVLYGKGKDNFSTTLKEYVEVLCEASDGKISYREGDGESLPPGLPAFSLSRHQIGSRHGH